MSACNLEDRVSRVKFEMMHFILWMQLVVLVLHRGHISECLALIMCLIFLTAQYTNFDGSVFSRTCRSIYSGWRNIFQEGVNCEGILRMKWDVFETSLLENIIFLGHGIRKFRKLVFRCVICICCTPFVSLVAGFWFTGTRLQVRLRLGSRLRYLLQWCALHVLQRYVVLKR